PMAKKAYLSRKKRRKTVQRTVYDRRKHRLAKRTCPCRKRRRKTPRTMTRRRRMAYLRRMCPYPARRSRDRRRYLLPKTRLMSETKCPGRRVRRKGKRMTRERRTAA